VAIMPAAMTAFSAWSNASAFGASPHRAEVFAAWLLAAAAVALAVGATRVAATYDPARREYALPGSAVPLLLSDGIFLVKWGVGGELALQPMRVADSGFALAIASIYGIFNGLFVGRFLRLARLARRPAPVVHA